MTKLVLLGLFFFFAVSVAQLSSGLAWQGTWSNSKRAGFSIGTYICVDIDSQTAHGTYGGVGVFSGSLHGNKFSGFWYESGYDRPFGPFDLTITGTGFTGTWRYYGSTNTSTTFTWSATRSSATEPTIEQCLTPSDGDIAEGTYVGNNAVCYDGSVTYANTNQQSISASFHPFGTVIGYSPDNGYTVLASDFYYDDDDNLANGALRPEGNGTPFGACADCDDDGDNAIGNSINTRRILVGRVIADGRFCGYFWKGLYKELIGNGITCYDRVSFLEPDGWSCRSEDIAHSSGLTSWILAEIQDALNNIVLPPVVIIPNDPFISKDTYFPSTHTTRTDSNTNSRSSTTVTDSNTNSQTSTSNPNTGSQISSGDSSFYTSLTSQYTSGTTGSASNDSATLSVSLLVLFVSAMVALI